LEVLSTSQRVAALANAKAINPAFGRHAILYFCRIAGELVHSFISFDFY
jgi:hypothetical protein